MLLVTDFQAKYRQSKQRPTWTRSLVLEEGVLLEEATEAGLLGPSFLFIARDLSRPFSGGEWAGLTRGVAGSWTGYITDERFVLHILVLPNANTPPLTLKPMNLSTLTSLETSTTKSSLLSPSLSCNESSGK